MKYLIPEACFRPLCGFKSGNPLYAKTIVEKQSALRQDYLAPAEMLNKMLLYLYILYYILYFVLHIYILYYISFVYFWIHKQNVVCILGHVYYCIPFWLQ